MKMQDKKTLTGPEQEANKFANAVLSVMESLATVLGDELRLLDSRDFMGMNAIRERKAKLVGDYQSNVKVLARRPDLLKQAPAPTQLRLRQVSQNLAEVTEQNAMKLQGAINATQALIQTVVTVARDQVKTTDCYSDPRKSPLMLGCYSPTCKPVAVDRTA